MSSNFHGVKRVNGDKNTPREKHNIYIFGLNVEEYLCVLCR